MRVVKVDGRFVIVLSKKKGGYLLKRRVYLLDSFVPNLVSCMNNCFPFFLVHTSDLQQIEIDIRVLLS